MVPTPYTLLLWGPNLALEARPLGVGHPPSDARTRDGRSGVQRGRHRTVRGVGEGDPTAEHTIHKPIGSAYDREIEPRPACHLHWHDCLRFMASYPPGERVAAPRLCIRIGALNMSSMICEASSTFALRRRTSARPISRMHASLLMWRFLQSPASHASAQSRPSWRSSAVAVGARPRKSSKTSAAGREPPRPSTVSA